MFAKQLSHYRHYIPLLAGSTTHFIRKGHFVYDRNHTAITGTSHGQPVPRPRMAPRQVRRRRSSSVAGPAPGRQGRRLSPKPKWFTGSPHVPGPRLYTARRTPRRAPSRGTSRSDSTTEQEPGMSTGGGSPTGGPGRGGRLAGITFRSEGQPRGRGTPPRAR